MKIIAIANQKGGAQLKCLNNLLSAIHKPGKLLNVFKEVIYSGRERLCLKK